ncbi:MAG TPA: cation:proton antiporter [Vicinamibacterales bacterium]|nr:cation:proton antiporter [Vicinamibacterales bacterium]
MFVKDSSLTRRVPVVGWDSAGTPLRGLMLAYTAVIAIAVVAVVSTIRVGQAWFPSSEAASAFTQVAAATAAVHGAAAALRNPTATLILQLLLIVGAAQLLGAVARALRQPVVIGEMAVGIVLGPTILGQLWPEASAYAFSASSLAHLQLISQFGVILYMFTVGLDVDLLQLRRRAHTAVAVSHVSIVVPFCLGVLAALGLYREYAPPGAAFGTFALFIGTALSITAFPVLTRILDERGLTRTPLGMIALACAAVDDITAWTLLAFVVALATAGGAGIALLSIVTLAGAFIALMVFVARPLVARFLDRSEPLDRGRVAIVLAIVFASALTTELVGVHALFGAFLAGTIMPAAGGVRDALRLRLETFASVVLLPVFFAFTGLRTEIGLLDDGASWLVFAAMLLVAVAGKLAGTLVAARATGSSWHDSFVLGVLMNTRGLMELIALNVGYDLGIISARMFTIMVLVALATTAAACPLIDVADALQRRRADRVPVPAG